jgi:hypothetical protein
MDIPPATIISTNPVLTPSITLSATGASTNAINSLVTTSSRGLRAKRSFFSTFWSHKNILLDLLGTNSGSIGTMHREEISLPNSTGTPAAFWRKTLIRTKLRICWSRDRPTLRASSNEALFLTAKKEALLKMEEMATLKVGCSSS